MRDGNVALLERSCSVASDLELAKTAVWTGDKDVEEFTTFFIKNKNNAIKELFNDLRVVSQSFIDYCVLSVDSKVKDYNSFWWKDQYKGILRDVALTREEKQDAISCKVCQIDTSRIWED